MKFNLPAGTSFDSKRIAKGFDGDAFKDIAIGSGLALGVKTVFSLIPNMSGRNKSYLAGATTALIGMGMNVGTAVALGIGMPLVNTVVAYGSAPLQERGFRLFTFSDTAEQPSGLIERNASPIAQQQLPPQSTPTVPDLPPVDYAGALKEYGTNGVGNSRYGITRGNSGIGFRQLGQGRAMSAKQCVNCGSKSNLSGLLSAPTENMYSEDMYSQKIY